MAVNNINLIYDTWSFGERSRLTLPEPKEVHRTWLTGELPKRARLISFLINDIDISYVDRITTYSGQSKKNGIPIIRVANFSRKLDIYYPRDVNILKNIFLKINLDSICSVDLFTNNLFSRDIVVCLGRSDKYYNRKCIYFSDYFNPDDDLKVAICHLGGNINLEVTQLLIDEVDSFFDKLFRIKEKKYSYDNLIYLHNKASDWARKMNLNITENDIFSDLLNLCIIQLCEECSLINESFLKKDDTEDMSVLFVVAHALCETQRIKVSQRVNEFDKKREIAMEWWNIYRNKTPVERRCKSEPLSQRIIAKKIGVSLGTLNGWFKDFDQST